MGYGPLAHLKGPSSFWARIIPGLEGYCSIGPVKQKIAISLNMFFLCSKEQSYRDSSFEYAQHMLWLRIKKNNFQLCTLIWGSVFCHNCSHITGFIPAKLMEI